MQAEFINAFLQAAIEILAGETALRVDRGRLSVQPSTSTTQEVNALVEVSGDHVVGMVIVGMTRDTALALVARMLDQPVAELDELTTSGIAELANVIATRACALLGEADYVCTITPAVLTAANVALATAPAIQRLVVPLHLVLGTVEIQVALMERGSRVATQT